MGIGILSFGRMLNKEAPNTTYYTNKTVTEKNKEISLNSIYPKTSISLSKEAEEAIEELCNSSIHYDYDSRYVDILNINEENATDAYVNLASDEVKHHTYTLYYDNKTDEIKWKELAEQIYQNGLSDDKEDIVTLSLEEIQEKLENMEFFVHHLKEDFPNYDVEELACRLNNFKMLKSESSSGNILANTDNKEMIYYNNYHSVKDIHNDYHEDFHVALDSCDDIYNYNGSSKSGGINVKTATYLNDNSEEERDFLYLQRYKYQFLEEIYAEIYSGELANEKQKSYIANDEVLDIIQLVLGLCDDYQIDSILKDLVYHDPISFIKHFPVYGSNKEQYFVNNCQMLKSYDILLEYPKWYQEELLKNDLSDSYGISGKNSLQLMAMNHLSKTFFNSLIVMNEKYGEELCIEDNYSMIYLFETYLQKANNAIESSSYRRIENYYALDDYKLSYDQYINTFMKYLGEKNNLDYTNMIIDYCYSFVPSEDYSFLSFMGEEKQDYYKQLLQYKDRTLAEPYPRTLKK